MTITKRAFLQAHQGHRIDLGKLAQDARARSSLRAAGVDLGEPQGPGAALTAEQAYRLVEQLPAGKQSQAALALDRLMAQPSLAAVDAPNTVFGAMLANRSTEPTAPGTSVPPVDLGTPLTTVAANPAGEASEPLVYVSANTIEGDATANVHGALGSYGPLGAWGPLAELGPVGDHWWNPSTSIDQANHTWGSEWDGRQEGGPLTEAGPLGERGPLGEAYISGALVNDGPALTSQLKALGKTAVLGPTGPLGPLGALGPLGPVGAHGFGTDDNGSYIDSGGQLQRTLDVWYDAGHTEKRSYELVERYSEDFAKLMTDNDTSFMVEGSIAYQGGGKYETDEFDFTSNSDQLVTVCVVPEKSLDDFDFEVTDQDGKLLAKSDSADNIDWVQMQVSKGTRLRARVKLKGSGHWFSKSYRLLVTGSTENIEPTAADTRADHLREVGA